jgi:hypothetical protein
MYLALAHMAMECVGGFDAGLKSDGAHATPSVYAGASDLAVGQDVDV